MKILKKIMKKISYNPCKGISCVDCPSFGDCEHIRLISVPIKYIRIFSIEFKLRIRDVFSKVRTFYMKRRSNYLNWFYKLKFNIQTGVIIR